MEGEFVKDEAGDVIHNENGDPQNNMTGAIASFILEHWCAATIEIANKHEMILMNLKCKKMSQYEDFHRDWTPNLRSKRKSE